MALNIGMSVPGASDLGLGGQLADQVGAETDEQRKKRLAQMQQQRFAGVSSLGLSPTGYGAGLTLGGF